MRLVFVLTLLFSLPMLLVAHLEFFSAKLQWPLYQQTYAALQAPEFAQVKATLSYMDVTLRGRVSDPDTRERARRLADGIRGLRCREEDNLLQVTARLEGTLAGRTLHVSGWLHDDVVLRDASRWLAAARPGIEVDFGNVRVNPHVTSEPAPGIGRVPPAFRSVWSAIERPASLRVVRKEGRLDATGEVPGAALKAAVIAALRSAAGAGSLDTSGLQGGAYVRAAPFATESLLPAFLKAFFATPGASLFEATPKTIRLVADATPRMQHDWTEMLEPLLRGASLKAEIRVFPSVFHYPGHLRLSHAPGGALPALQELFRASTIHFGKGETTPEPVDEPKLGEMAAAIIAAGPDVRVVVGGHVDTDGDASENAVMARRRADGVAASLVAKGVASPLLETSVFESVPDGVDQSRQVELLIK